MKDTLSVIELRQYLLRPGQRDVLIELFEREFIETQEAAGMRLIGQFRDLERSDRFVWLRGFSDMRSRRDALHAFYGGPVWKAHRDRANATMLDSDDVLLLRPVRPGAGLALPLARGAEKERGDDRPGRAAAEPSRRAALIVPTIYLLGRAVDEGFVRFFDERVMPVMIETGASPIARYQTEPAENDFPALPVRPDHAFVWFAAFETESMYQDHLERLRRSRRWNESVLPDLSAHLKSPPERFTLEPTARSLLGDPPSGGGLHDFDFIAGVWDAQGRRLEKRGVGSTEWYEFPATIAGRLLLGGVANVDEVFLPTLGWSGSTFRVFDRVRQKWSIYWVNSRTGILFPPVVGAFIGDVGLFYGDDDDDGRPVNVRFTWQKLGPSAAHWEQAFSYDGQTWETNWVMEMTRRR